MKNTYAEFAYTPVHKTTVKFASTLLFLPPNEGYISLQTLFPRTPLSGQSFTSKIMCLYFNGKNLHSVILRAP